MEASPTTTMVGDYSVRSTGSTSQNSARFNGTGVQKARRLENITARLQPTRSCTSSTTVQQNGVPSRKPSNPGSIKAENGGKSTCHQCLTPIKSPNEGLLCVGCKKSVHTNCSTSLMTKDNQYLCPSCRKHSVFPGTSTQAENEEGFGESEIGNSERPVTRRQALSNSASSGTTMSPTAQTGTPSSSTTNSSTSTPVTTPQPRKASVPPGPSQKYSVPPVINTDFDIGELPPQIPTGSSFTSSIDDEISMANSEMHSPASSTGLGTSNRGSPARTEGSPTSENDDSRPPSSRKILKESGSKSKNNGSKESKRTAARQSSMKTRSGGKPSGLSYAHLGKGGNERRKPSVKGKGKSANTARSRRPRATNRMSFIQSIASTRRESEETNDPDEPKTRQPDENDYIRTAIVSSSDNPFVCMAPMCLICGSIGRDSEATMMSCMSCCQTYHSYCVNMHDKLNKTIIKRGWRCLQCTVCEACGDGADESNLLLCDECDVAFHTYCLEPKLDKIPTGSWRCHWCATCRRCNKQVQAGLDLQRLQGLCEPCHSLRKCPKCHKLYQTGDLMIRCQHCSRWFHGACEDLTTEEQLETAYENAFRCSLCRPRANTDYNDVMNQSVIIDNVMVNKSALEMLKLARSGSSLGNLGDITGSFRSQFADQNLLDNDDIGMDDLDFGAGGRGRSRISGPGRRPPKLGIGGFIVKNRNRTTQSVDEEGGTVDKEEPDDKSNAIGKHKRRPRKPRKHQLEDAYPINIQQAFWGIAGVDGKTVVEMQINEPVLEDSQHYVKEHKKIREVFELSDQAADALRSQQEQDMIGDMLGDDMDIDNLDNFDFSNFLGDDDDDFEDDFSNDTNQDQSGDQQEGQEPGRIELPQDRHRLEMQRSHHHHSGSNDTERVNQATERWIEDEPLGDRATKAPVLYANMEYPHLKTEFPNWADRARQIQKNWRNLESDKRQKYVQKARDNRANRTRAPRKRGINQLNRPDGSSQSGILESSVPRSSESREDTMSPRQSISNVNGNHPIQHVQLNGPVVNSIGHVGNEIVTQVAPTAQVVVHINSQQQHGVAGSSNEFRNGHGNIIVRELSGGNNNPRPQVTTRTVTAEIAQRFDNLKRQQDSLKHRQEQLDTNLTQLRKIRKSLNARKRQLNKHNEVDANGEKVMHELSEVDQEKMADVGKNIAQSNRDVDLVKRELKDIQNQLDELESQYGIISVTAIHTSAQFLVCNEPTSSSSLTALAPGSTINGQSLIVRTPETGSPVSMASPRFSFSTRTMSTSSFGSGMVMNGIQRADSVSSLGDPSTPGTIRSMSSMSTEAVIQKPSRGRKRKKPLTDPLRPQRSSSLGGVVFADLKTDDERIVYDVLDGILNEICGIEMNEPDVKRLLMTHAPPSEHLFSISPTALDAPKKKKRMTTKKTAPMNEACEYEVVLEKLQNSLNALPPIPSPALNPLPSYDPATFITSDTTKLPDNGADVLIEGSQFGSIGLSFMTDFYNDFEEHCEVITAREELPIQCSGLYSTVRLDALKEPDLDNNQEKIFTETSDEPFYDLSFENEVPKDDLDQLNIDRIREQEGIELHIPSVPRWPELDLPPCDPPRSAWKENYENNLENINIELVVDYLEDIPTESIVAKIASVLRPDGDCIDEIEFGIESAPVLSPGATSCPDLDDDIPECCGCGIPLLQENIYEHELEGAFREKYCNEQCYIEYNRSEESKVVLPETEVKLEEQLTIEINDKESIPPLPSPNENEEDWSFCDPDKLILLDSLRQPREFEYTVAELPQPIKPTIEVTPGGSRAFKFKGQGWMICDEKLLSTFRKPLEDTRTAIQEHCGNWNTLSQKDRRKCAFCNEIGDGLPSLTGRLLNVDANEWVHVNCAIWSSEVHESECGGLNNVQAAIKQAKITKCLVCSKNGASIKCIKLECESWYHLPCAYRTSCKFMKDTNNGFQTVICTNHGTNVHPDVKVEELDALRRIYVEREENSLLSKIYNNSFSCDMIMRIGSLVFYQIGQLLPDQLRSFHDTNYIYPIGFKVTRIFWHPRDVERRIPYECTIEDVDNKPCFRITFEGKEITDFSPQNGWLKILNSIQQIRDRNGTVLRFFPSQISGHTLFGFHEVPVTKMIESLPGIDQLHSYEFKHGGVPLMEVPLAVNPTGCARTEPCFRTLIKSKKTLASPQKHEDRPASSSSITNKRKRRRPANDISNHYDENTLKMLKASGISEEMLATGKCEYNGGNSAQIYSRYKTMKSEWKSYVALGRSRIAGFGLYAKKDICMYQMVCEYVGEIIRSEVCEIREKKYSQKNMGIYMFRIDSELVIDATKSGNMARYINHSCDPNCFTQIINIDNVKKIVIIAGRPIKAGEELCYDYQFELEDTKDKIPCLCGAPNCVKWMN